MEVGGFLFLCYEFFHDFFPPSSLFCSFQVLETAKLRLTKEEISSGSSL